MSTMNSIEQDVIAIIADALGKKKEEITTKSRFKEDLQADSLNTVELMMKLEGEFKIEIPDDEASKILTVADVIEYIKNYQQK